MRNVTKLMSEYEEIRTDLARRHDLREVSVDELEVLGNCGTRLREMMRRDEILTLGHLFNRSSYTLLHQPNIGFASLEELLVALKSFERQHPPPPRDVAMAALMGHVANKLHVIRELRKALEPFVKGWVDSETYDLGDWHEIDARAEEVEQRLLEQAKKEEAD